jgi:putative radical SAM enzyme (TIGR03279 family)
VSEGGGLVAVVRPGSPADTAGIVAGDRILRASDHALRDTIDWRWHASESTVTVEVRQGAVTRETTLERAGGDWGIEFAEEVFDAMRTCENACEFCFVSQLPEGLRSSLYVRDDDFRLSFLTGNFVTLTNVDEDDVARIVEQRLSPLYVSLHAVDEGVRARLLGRRTPDTALETLVALLGEGVEVHAQIVLVPGVNDGAVLEATLEWAERPGIRSVGVVPAGYTRHGCGAEDSFDRDGARALLEALEGWRRARIGRGETYWVHAADEFYLLAGVEMPPETAYDGYPQYENGIGLTRSFVEEWRSSAASFAGATAEEGREAASWTAGIDAVLCTGELFAPVFDGLVKERAVTAGLRVLAVANEFFGGGVSVAGLLTSEDIVRTIRQDQEDGALPTTKYLVPSVVLNEDGLTLDDVDVQTTARLTGCDVRFVPERAGGLLDALYAMARGE